MQSVLIRRPAVRTYLSYILPSVIALTLTSIYGVFDGIFVGHAVGDAGLAGINVAFPLQTLVMAAAMGIGMGSAVISSVEKGKGDLERSARAAGNAFVLLLCAAVPLALLLNLFARPLCQLLGGSGETLDQAAAYISVIAWGVPFQVFVGGSMALIRNRGGVKYAMVIQILSGLINIVLDYLFVIELGFGIKGAAAATVIGQCFAFCSCVVFFGRKKNRLPRAAFKPDGALMRHALRLGLAPFGLTLLPDATVVVINVNANMVGGEAAVATYAVISYVAFIAQLLIQGVADGSQPLVSMRHGGGDRDAVRRLRNTNYLVCFGIGVVGLAALTLLSRQVPVLFGASAATVEAVAHALPIYSVSYLLYAFTHPSISYFYAIDDAKASTRLVVGEAMLVVAVVCIMARLWGLDGIWWSVTVVQALLGVLALVELRRARGRA